MHKTLNELADSFWASYWNSYNPGFLLDEHKRNDSIILRELFLKKKNERMRVLKNLHLKVNELQHLHAQEPSSVHPDRITIANTKLKEKLNEQKYYSSKRKFTSDLESTERCSKKNFRPPAILHKMPIPVDLIEDLESTCSSFLSYWSGIYCSPSKEFGHSKPKWDPFKLVQILQDTKSRLTLTDQAYLDSPFTAFVIYWALNHTAIGKTPGPDGLPVEYYKTDVPLWSRIFEVIYAAQF